MSIILRSINLLDGQFTQVSTVFREESWAQKEDQEAFIKGIDIPKTNPKPSLKRRVGYSEEVFSATRARLSSMQIDDSDEDSVRENLLTKG
jgi:hypothetical protein